jgi:hypothetical protein
MPTGCPATHFDGALVAGRVRVQERGERRVLAVAEALASFPVALLTYTEAQP